MKKQVTPHSNGPKSIKESTECTMTCSKDKRRKATPKELEEKKKKVGARVLDVRVARRYTHGQRKKDPSPLLY